MQYDEWCKTITTVYTKLLILNPDYTPRTFDPMCIYLESCKHYTLQLLWDNFTLISQVHAVKEIQEDTWIRGEDMLAICVRPRLVKYSNFVCYLKEKKELEFLIVTRCDTFLIGTLRELKDLIWTDQIRSKKSLF